MTITSNCFNKFVLYSLWFIWQITHKESYSLNLIFPVIVEVYDIVHTLFVPSEP